MTALKIKKALAFAVICLVWGATALALKFTIVGIPPFLQCTVRFFVAGTILAIIAVLKKGEVVGKGS